MTTSYRSDFPIFQRYPNLAYLDNAATTQRPQAVIDAMNDFYAYENANIHRGIYDLSNKATANYEKVRESVASFLGSDNPKSVAFTRGTTESINVVARSFVQPNLKKGDNVVITMMEHHANFLPWQVICDENQAELRILPVSSQGDLLMEKLVELLDENTKILAITHISNTLGSVNPIRQLIKEAHLTDIPVLVDAAQSAAYYDLDIRKLDCDFLTFSAHKLFGPFGVGVLFAAERHIDHIKPYNYGGGMIRQVAVEGSSFSTYPYNLEAGTPNIAGVIGLGQAIDYLNSLNRNETLQHLQDLTAYGTKRLQEIDQVHIVGSPREQSGIISFVVDDIHPHDVASFLSKDEIALRAGMHCTQPLLAHLQIPATARVSFSIYNTRLEIDRLHDSLIELIKFWS